LKRKFLVTVLAAVSIASLLTAFIVYIFLEREAVRYIDQQLQTIASSIFASGLSIDMMEDLDNVDDLLMEKLSDQKFGRLVRIYNRENRQLLYANEPGRFTYMPEPVNEGFETVESSSRMLRILNISNSNYLLQVGLTIDPVLDRNSFLEKQFLVFSLGLSIIIVLTTFLALKNLLRPLHKMTMQLEKMTFQLKNNTQLIEIAKQFRQEVEMIDERSKKDEIALLQKSLALFAVQMAQALDRWQSQHAVLAHEIKTPLTLIRNNISTLVEKASSSQNLEDLSQNKLRQVLVDVDGLAKLVSDFLNWGHLSSHLEANSGLFANKIEEVVSTKIKKLNQLYQDRIQEIQVINRRLDSQGNEENLELLENINLGRVVCLPEHLEQAVRNVIENACKYSRPECKVHVFIEVSEDSINLQIIDYGNGLPDSVKQNMGTPFNRGVLDSYGTTLVSGSGSGSGLGLAWVTALCKLYNWRLTSSLVSPSKFRISWDKKVHQMELHFPLEN
jgi:signal transduction histidine kinase